MDMIGEILRVLIGLQDGVTMRHIAYQTDMASTTLVGVMMVMLNQGYVVEIQLQPDSETGRCRCACCRKKPDQERSSLDRRLFKISAKGEQYLSNWAEIVK